VTEQRFGLRVAATIFAVVSLAQITRIATHLEVSIAGRTIPIWPSVIAAVVTGSVSIWLWILSKRGQGT
jgi:hypothetical protein